MTKEQELTKVKGKFAELIEELEGICNNCSVELETKKESEKDLEVLWIARNRFGRWALIIHNKDQADKIRKSGGEVKRVVVC